MRLLVAHQRLHERSRCRAVLLWLAGAHLDFRARATPALAALQRYRAEHGHYPQANSTVIDEFPRELQAPLRSARCPLYRPSGAAFDLTCNGVAFTKCTFEAASGRWRSWD